MNQNLLFVLIPIILLASGIGAVLYVKTKRENNELRMQNYDLRKDKWRLLLDSVKNAKKISHEVKFQIEKLVEQNKNLNPDVAAELKKVLNHIEIGEEVTAAFSLSKIVENLLKNRYKNDAGFKQWQKAKKGRKLTFATLLEYAKNKLHLDKIEYLLASALREIRNKEAHELNVQEAKNIVDSSLLTGIQLVCKLS